MRVFAILVFLASATAASAADMVNGFALLRLADGVYAMYQESEGWPGEPRMVKLDGAECVAKLLRKTPLGIDLALETFY